MSLLRKSVTWGSILIGYLCLFYLAESPLNSLLRFIRLLKSNSFIQQILSEHLLRPRFSPRCSSASQGLFENLLLSDSEEILAEIDTTEKFSFTWPFSLREGTTIRTQQQWNNHFVWGANSSGEWNKRSCNNDTWQPTNSSHTHDLKPTICSELDIFHAICSSGDSHGLSSIDPHFVGVETQAQRGEVSNFLWGT